MAIQENLKFPPSPSRPTEQPFGRVLKGARIGIDARFYGPVGKGLGRYTQEIVDNIIKLDRTNEYVIFLSRENWDNFNIGGGAADEKRIRKVLLDIRWYGLKEQLLFPFQIWRRSLDLMHFPHFNVPIFCPTKFIVTIHDLILLKFSTRRATTLGPLLYALKKFFYKIVIALAVSRARKILTVSECAKNDIVRQFKIDRRKIIVTYEGVSGVLSRGLAEKKDEKGGADNFGRVLQKYNIIKPYLLYVGNAYPHKNLEGLIRVFSVLSERRKNLRLVLVGKEDYFYRRLKDWAGNLSAKIIFPGYAPDSDLKILYSEARAYVFPSFYEGFGLPALEAMACGLPVASSDKTCLPEILGQAALYFNPEDERDMEEKIESVITDEKLRHDLIKKGFEQVKKYGWSQCAQETLEVYRSVIPAQAGIQNI